MNLKGSHLLYLVIILFANYLAYSNNFPWWSYYIEYVFIFIKGIFFISVSRDSLDFRMYDDPNDAKIDRDDYINFKSENKSWYKYNLFD